MFDVISSIARGDLSMAVRKYLRHHAEGALAVARIASVLAAVAVGFVVAMLVGSPWSIAAGWAIAGWLGCRSVAAAVVAYITGNQKESAIR